MATAKIKTNKSASPLTIELTTPVDDNRPVFLVGNFNNWTIDDPKFRMRRVAQGKFIFTFPTELVLPKVLEYKYVRGGWENKELDDFGNSTQNRKIDTHTGFLNDFVPRWSDYGLNFPPRFLPKIRVVDEQFEIPQLKKKRKITVLLPFDYDKQPQKRYPVVYMHDAQNLFNPHSPYGNWAIDQKMAVLAERGMGDLIIVGIDHAGADRINEFLPVPNKNLGSMEGKKYVDFVAQTLKPHIDKQYRTLPDRLHTGMGGSSMGGLITIFAGLRYPSVFGRLMVFSPSLWVARSAPINKIDFSKFVPTKIYAYAGGKEGAEMVPNVTRFQDAIKARGMNPDKVQFNLSVDWHGTHSESRWGNEFPKAVEWLFFS